MDFRKDALKMLDEMSGVVSEKVVLESKKTNSVDVEFILEGLDEEISDTVELEKIPEKDDLNFDIEQKSFKFLGKLNEAPNPLEYGNGTMYKDVRNGTVYIVQNGLWESLVEDGKQGAQGRQGAAGSGTGIEEVKTVATQLILSATQNIRNTGTQITYDPIQKINVLDPRKNRDINCTLIRNNNTSAVDLTYVNELLVIGTNSVSSTNAVNVLLFDNLITQTVMTSGSPLSTSARSFPHPTNKSVNVTTQSNSSAIAVMLGE